MGTSGPYKPSPKWADVKTELTKKLNSDEAKGEAAKEILADFVEQLAKEKEEGFGELGTDFGKLDPNESIAKLDSLLSKYPARTSASSGAASSGGGPQASTGSRKGRSGGGGGGGGGARGYGAVSVRPTAQRLAQFISEVPKHGLKQALRNAGVTDVDKMQPEDLAIAVADVLLADASLLIMAELRDALATVIERLCEDAKTLTEAEGKLNASAAKLETVVQSLFECYIVERFKTFFCEHEAPKHGYDAADKVLKEARLYIKSEMELERVDRRDLTAVDWTGPEGAKIVDAILEKTIAIYTN